MSPASNSPSAGPATPRRPSKALLSWQRPIHHPAPSAWKVGLFVAFVLGIMLALEHFAQERAELRRVHVENGIRNNIVTLADAAGGYMAAHNVKTVSEQALFAPGGPLTEQPHEFSQENYTDIDFSLDDPRVWVHIPDGPTYFFNINWSRRGKPGFVLLVEQHNFAK